MRRPVGTLIVVASVLLSVALAVAVNVATAGGRGGLWAWLLVALCTVATAGLADLLERLPPP
jgi:hypothetical protein